MEPAGEFPSVVVAVLAISDKWCAKTMLEPMKISLGSLRKHRPLLLNCSGAKSSFQRHCRGLQQQSKTDYQKKDALWKSLYIVRPGSTCTKGGQRQNSGTAEMNRRRKENCYIRSEEQAPERAEIK